MSKIKILTPELINKIAAGEVIERPASIIKELVENSIDAQANNINLQIESGGKSLIKVTDDGIGMNNEDLLLCLKPHTTSKLTEENLFSISTLGFRGEALASIAAVSNVTIASASQDNSQGFSVNSKNNDLTPHSIKKGTSIKVSSLFYNTPARLKFLKGDSYETTQCYKILKRLALSNPSVNFKLENNNKIVFNYLAKGETSQLLLENRVAEVMGKDFINNSIYIGETNPMLKVYGFISTPTFSKSNQDNQFVAINGRSIKDKLITGIIKFAYSEVLFSRNHPSYALFIEINEKEIDVNVNPTKSEIRFKDNQFIRYVLLNLVKNNLGKTENQSKNNFGIRNFKSATNTSKNPINLNIFAPQPESQSSYFSIHDNQKPSLLKEDIRPFLEEQKEIPKNNENIDYPLGIAKAQFHKNWIIAQSNNGIILIDQHAAHERITQEKLKKQFQQNGIHTQLLITPEIMELDPVSFEIAKLYQNKIITLGIDFDIFGINVVLIKSTPQIFGNINAKELFKDLLTDLDSIENIESFDKKINEIISSMACHGSIRSGKTLSVHEMNDLLRQMEQTTNYAQCSHGRPTFINLSLQEIEKLFKRS